MTKYYIISLILLITISSTGVAQAQGDSPAAQVQAKVCWKPIIDARSKKEKAFCTKKISLCSAQKLKRGTWNSDNICPTIFDYCARKSAKITPKQLGNEKCATKILMGHDSPHTILTCTYAVPFLLGGTGKKIAQTLLPGMHITKVMNISCIPKIQPFENATVRSF